MNKKPSQINFWYAVHNTSVVLPPQKSLETFGSTIIQYHLVSELMDVTGKVRIREGRLQAMRPRIIVPNASDMEMEGFGEEAQAYMQWLKKNEDNVRILQYGYSLKQEAFSEQVVTDSVKNVLDRVTREVKSGNNPFDAVVLGVDDPWDVCLVRLFWVVTMKSIPSNLREFEQGRQQELQDGIPTNVRLEVERAFSAAEKNPDLVKSLGVMLQQYGVFEHYQDRFFGLFHR